MEIVIWLAQNPHPSVSPESTPVASVCFIEVKNNVVETHFLRKMKTRIVVLLPQN